MGYSVNLTLVNDGSTDKSIKIVKKNFSNLYKREIVSHKEKLVCLIKIIFIFLTIIIRSLLLILKKREAYSLILVVGLVSIFGLQALINISSAIGASPTKGMTLPLISYGGSSIVSISILSGIILNLTKRKVN